MYRLLDLYCGAGGAAAGYVRAGFEVTGVDIVRQPHYRGSEASRFVQSDAIDYLLKYGKSYDVIHASPPCQAYSPLRYLSPGKIYPDLIEATRASLIQVGVLWIIENVMTAPLTGIALCGSMFGLRTYRHRRFESSIPLTQPRHPLHDHQVAHMERTKGWSEGKNISVIGNAGKTIPSLAMGIYWMNGRELSQAIPPAYTEFIGKQVLAYLSGGHRAETSGSSEFIYQGNDLSVV